MEGLPDEVVLSIFSFVPAKFLFRSVSAVCKRFHRLAYDRASIRRSEVLLKEINLRGKSESTVQRVLTVITKLPSHVVRCISIQDCTTTWQVFDVLAANCEGLKILNLSSMKGVLKLGKVVKPFVFRQLLELNVSGTMIDDNFIFHLSESCKALYSLNISCCPYITDIGLTKVNFNLTLFNIAHCHFQFPTIAFILHEFDVQVLCIQGIHTGLTERTSLASMFPSSLDIGIPLICGFSLRRYHNFPEYLCFWCRNSKRCTFLDSDVDPDKLYEI